MDTLCTPFRDLLVSCGLVSATTKNTVEEDEYDGGLQLKPPVAPPPAEPKALDLLPEFQEALQKAQEEVETIQSSNPSLSIPMRFSGTYEFKWNETTLHSSSLLFTPDLQGRGYQIGSLHRKGGLIEGLVNYQGHAWWTVQSDSETVRLSKGTFSQDMRTFEGTWLQSDMTGGIYEEGCLTSGTKDDEIQGKEEDSQKEEPQIGNDDD